MIGKAGTAPCGHRGEHVIGTYVRCLAGCDIGNCSEPGPAVRWLRTFIAAIEPLRRELGHVELASYEFEALALELELGNPWEFWFAGIRFVRSRNEYHSCLVPRSP